MKFEKLYLFNPFTIEKANSEEIAKTYSELQNEIIEEPEAPFEFAKNIELYANMNYLIGEMIARLTEEYVTAKTQISIVENKQIYISRKQWEETNKNRPPAMSYFEAMAKEFVKKDLEELAQKEAKLFRFKKAYDSIEQKMNALKKKMEATKYEI